METGKVTLAHSLYQQIIRLQVRYVALMSIVALVVGLFYREFSRPFFRGLALEQRMAYGHFLELVHGHTFLLGAAIPVTMALLTSLVRGDLDIKSMLNLSLRFKGYMWASAVSLVLMLYKGVAFVVGAGQPLDAIDAGLFFGSRILRGVLLGGAHVALFWALAAYMYELLRAGKRAAS
jgi:hypothetical protein